jgi:predicted transcriptional regulator
MEIDAFRVALRGQRGHRDLTTAQLGERAGLAGDLVERIEDGKHDPYLTEIVALAHALDRRGTVRRRVVGALTG